MKSCLSESVRLTPAVAALVSALAASAQAAPADDAERRSLDDLARSAPATFALCKQADEALRAGDLAQAGKFYGRARAASPKEVVPARGACRVALARGQETDAMLACQRAFMLGGTSEDMRNTVAAMMGTTTRPAMTELASASLLAEGAVRTAPNEPWGYVARCDIARRLGDRVAMDACLSDLKRVAPEREETRRTLALAALPASPWTWLGRALLVFGLLGTLLHAIARRRRLGGGRRGSFPASNAVIVSVIAALAASFAVAPRTARAEPGAGKGERLSNYAIDSLHPEASIPSLEKQNSDPIEFGYFLQDMLADAQAATARRDHAAAARYYRALAIAVPSRSYAFGKACTSYELAGDNAHAVDACREALSREGVTVEDFSHFVVVMLAQKEPLTPAQKKELGEVLDHLGAEPGAGIVAQRLRCDVALRVHNVLALEACTALLETAAPEDPKTISFHWALALEKHDRTLARALIDRARKAGMAKEGVARMEEATERDARARLLRFALIGLGAALAGALAVFASRRLSAWRRTMPA